MIAIFPIFFFLRISRGVSQKSKNIKNVIGGNKSYLNLETFRKIILEIGMLKE